MEKYEVFFFGQFHLRCRGVAWHKPNCGKAWQLFWYLASQRRATHTRDALAGLFWGDIPNEQAKKQLRQALWRLHAEEPSLPPPASARLIVVEGEHVRLNPAIEWWIDAEVFEQQFAQLRCAQALDADGARAVRQAIALYRGDFLEGCYQDWCLYGRERLQNQYLALLDKLMDYCLSQGDYEEGLQCGARVLQINPGSERAHRQMMKLHYLAGDRTAAIQQYQHCQKALKEELGVAPAAASQALFAQICADQPGFAPAAVAPLADYAKPKSLQEVLGHLKQFQTTLSVLQQQIQQDIRLVEDFLPSQRVGRPASQSD